MERILLKNGTLVTLDPQQPLLKNSALVVCNGKIESVSGEAVGPFTRVVDASGYILMPGLVNAHTHSPMTLLRGLKDDCNLDVWLRDYIWPAESSLTRQDYRIGAMLGIAEMLATGTTCMTDMYRASGELFSAVVETGIKANICDSILSDDEFDPKTNTGVQESLRTFREWNGYDNGRILCDTSIQSCWQSPPSMWRYIGDMALEHGMGIHIHLAETQSEMEHCRSRYGATPVKLLHDAGVFRNRVAAVHGIYLSEEDQQILLDSGAVIVHDPCSNLKCCCGFANLKPYSDKGIPIALGTDGVCSNNTGDMFDTIKLTSLLQKMLNNQPDFLQAEELLKMATQNGLLSQGRTNEAGMLRPGLDADIIAVDANFPSMQPLLSPAGNLVYSANGAMVRMTMVRGKILYENGEFTTIDIDRLYHQVKQITDRY